MNRQSIAAQLYTLRDVLKTPDEIARSLRKVKEIGYDAVQVSGLGPIEPARLHEITGELGLRICATHISYDALQQDLPSVIATHKLWNCDYVGLGMLPEPYRTSRSGYESFIREFSDIGRRLEEQGLHLVYHNHQIEFERFDGVTGMDLLLEGANSDTYSLELDTYWVQVGGVNPSELIRKAAGNLHVIHLKDMKIAVREQVFAEIGQGNFNWTEILEACAESDVKWYVVEQDICRRDPFASLAMSLNYLQQRT